MATAVYSLVLDLYPFIWECDSVDMKIKTVHLQNEYTAANLARNSRALTYTKDECDLWSVGCTIFECATGRLPFLPANGLFVCSCCSVLICCFCFSFLFDYNLPSITVSSCSLCGSRMLHILNELSIVRSLHVNC